MEFYLAIAIVISIFGLLGLAVGVALTAGVEDLGHDKAWFRTCLALFFGGWVWPLFVPAAAAFIVYKGYKYAYPKS